MLVAGVLGLAAAGCGGDDDGGGGSGAQAGTVNESSAKAMASGTVSAVNAAGTDQGLQVSAGIQQAGSAASGIIQPSAGGTQSFDALGVVSQALAAGDCTCDDAAKKCVFDKCTSGTAEISGELSWANGKLTCTNLTYVIDQAAAGTSTTITTNCDLTYSATQIDGTLSSSVSGSTTAGGYSVTYAVKTNVKFNAVTYSSGSATGGSIDVSGTYDVTTNGQSGKYQGSATVTFP